MNNHLSINNLDMSFIFISEYNQTYHTYRLVILVYILLCVKISLTHMFHFLKTMVEIHYWLFKQRIQKLSTFLIFILFFQLVVMIGVRKMLDFIFTKEELKILDDILPEFKRKQKLEKEEEIEKEVGWFFISCSESPFKNVWSSRQAIRKPNLE